MATIYEKVKKHLGDQEDMELVIESYDDNKSLGRIMAKRGKIFCQNCWDLRMKTIGKAIRKKKSEADFSEKFIDMVTQVSIVEAI